MALPNFNVKNPDPEKYKLALVDPSRVTSLDEGFEVVPAREAKRHGFVAQDTGQNHILHHGLVLVRRPLTDAEKKTAKADELIAEQAERLDEVATAEREANEEILLATATEPGKEQKPEFRGAPRLVESAEGADGEPERTRAARKTNANTEEQKGEGE